MLLKLVVFLDVKDKTKHDQLSLCLLTFSPVFTYFLSFVFCFFICECIYRSERIQSGSLTFFVSVYQLTGLLWLHMMESPFELSLRE